MAPRGGKRGAKEVAGDAQVASEEPLKKLQKSLLEMEGAAPDEALERAAEGGSGLVPEKIKDVAQSIGHGVEKAVSKVAERVSEAYEVAKEGVAEVVENVRGGMEQQLGIAQDETESTVEHVKEAAEEVTEDTKPPAKKKPRKAPSLELKKRSKTATSTPAQKHDEQEEEEEDPKYNRMHGPVETARKGTRYPLRSKTNTEDMNFQQVEKEAAEAAEVELKAGKGEDGQKRKSIVEKIKDAVLHRGGNKEEAPVKKRGAGSDASSARGKKKART